MKQRLFSLVFACLFFFVAGGVALADSPASSFPSTFSVANLVPDMGPVGVLATAVCGGLFGMWGIRKIIKLCNRS